MIPLATAELTDNAAATNNPALVALSGVGISAVYLHRYIVEPISLYGFETGSLSSKPVFDTAVTSTTDYTRESFISMYIS